MTYRIGTDFANRSTRQKIVIIKGGENDSHDRRLNTVVTHASLADNPLNKRYNDAY